MTQPKVAMAEIGYRLRAIDRVFMVKDLATRGRGLDDVIRYYRDSSLGYRVIHSKGGAMHMALTPSGAFNEVGYYGQADAIKALFEASTRRVLELACGKGFNCNYLAARNADIDFFGIDVVERHLTTAQKQAKGLANVHYVAADFQTLPFSDGFFDSVFAVEGLCHALNLSSTLEEAARSLRPSGTLIVIDAWRTPEFSKLPSLIRRAASLTSTQWQSVMLDSSMSGHQLRRTPGSQCSKIAPPALGSYSAATAGSALAGGQQQATFPPLPEADPAPLPVLDYAVRSV